MTGYLLRHLQVFFYSLGQLARSPFATTMTVAVIGIALALPAGLYVLLDNARQASAGWSGKPQISIFLKQKIDANQAQQLAARLRKAGDIDTVAYISRKAAFEEFKRLSGFGAALNALEENPLPAVLVVHAPQHHQDSARLEALRTRLATLPQVELAQLDLEWLQRLQAIIALAQRGVVVLALILAIGVLLIVSNTVRLAILNRRAEIEIITLIGGTPAFIRRPFLYSGAIQGLFGALTAWLVVHGALAALAGPLHRLAGLYSGQFRLSGLGAPESLTLLASGMALGWLASRISIGRHLRQAIRPG